MLLSSRAYCGLLLVPRYRLLRKSLQPAHLVHDSCSFQNGHLDVRVFGQRNSTSQSGYTGPDDDDMQHGISSFPCFQVVLPGPNRYGTLWQQMNKRRPRTGHDSLFRVTRHFYCRATWPEIDSVLGFTNTGMQRPGQRRLSVQCTQTLSLLPDWCCVTSWLTTHIFLGGEWFFF